MRPSQGGAPAAIDLVPLVERHMAELLQYPDRNVGGPGNLAATAMFAREAARLGLQVDRRWFDCMGWEGGAAALEAGGESFPLHVGHYSLGVDASGPLVVAQTVEDLEREEVAGAVVLIRGSLAAGQIMPKGFTFYNPESHKRIVRALEERPPVAVVAATGLNPGLAGSQYPFPLFEDGDLDVPNAYMKDVEGDRLAASAGERVHVRIESRRLSLRAEHITARRSGRTPGRIVLSAHIDSAIGSPGALDNASGVTALLVVAELLTGHEGGPSIEYVPFNGEDNYANPGEMLWVADNEGRTDDIVLAINIDDVGMRGSGTQVSFYGVPGSIEGVVRDAMGRRHGISEGPQWYQSDHAIFAMLGRPAIALLTSEGAEFMSRYAHSERDDIGLLDPALVTESALLIADIVRGVSCLETTGD